MSIKAYLMIVLHLNINLTVCYYIYKITKILGAYKHDKGKCLF